MIEIRDNIPWKYAECLVENDENLLFSLYYRYEGTIAERIDGKDWHGLNSFIFHIVECEKGLFIKYLSLKGLEDKASHYAREAMSNIGWYQEEIYGTSQKTYKNYIKNEVMKCVKIQREKFMKIIKELGNIDYDKLEYFSSKLSEESVDYCDYINKKYFYCDKYCPEEYSKCIEMVDFILRECEILNMEKTNFKIFKEKEKQNIMKELIKYKIKLEGGILI